MCIFIDLKKAFDTVNHSILLKKLEKFGMRGVPLVRITNYLKDRKQFVIIAGQVSSQKTINIGVPQGSILGPVLFLVYINDLPRISDLFSALLYADDTTFVTRGVDYNALMSEINNELPKLEQWLRANRLSLNIDKTFSILFSNRHDSNEEDINIIFGDHEIELVANVKYL